ncbi:hypothetical protein B0H11DRAFT_1943836 [Mycena galericulata]|nr:hypothetical protein B0H11DRAFT_1943836 [Mycena galericulata]
MSWSVHRMSWSVYHIYPFYLMMEEEGHVQIMYPHLARRRRRNYKPPVQPRSRPTPSPYGHGLDGTNAPPVVVTRPAAYRQPAASSSGAADRAQRENDAMLLARLAESRQKQEQRQLKRKAGPASDSAAKRKSQIEISVVGGSNVV